MAKERLPQYIDPIKFAEQRRILDGVVQLNDMHRLQNMCLSEVKLGLASAHLEGDRDEEKRFFLRGTIEATIPLMCQRCLERMDFNLKASFLWSPVVSEAQAEELPAVYDEVFLDAQHKLNLTEAIEEEILLALPLVAKHETCGNLKVPQTEHKQEKPLKTTRPFGQLKDLIQKESNHGRSKK